MSKGGPLLSVEQKERLYRVGNQSREVVEAFRRVGVEMTAIEAIEFIMLYGLDEPEAHEE